MIDYHGLSIYYKVTQGVQIKPFKVNKDNEQIY